MTRGQRGFTFLELVIVTSILMILASTIMPLTQVTQQRQREVELRRTLREMRTAIDNFKDAVDQGRIPTTELEPGNEGYPLISRRSSRVYRRPMTPPDGS